MKYPAICGAALFALSSAPSAYASMNDQFTCEPLGDGAYIVVIDATNPDNAEAIYSMGMDSGNTQNSTPLKRAPSASGVLYIGEDISFHSKGNEGVLTSGTETVNCSYASNEATQEPQAGGSEILNVPGLSLGGKVRSEPNTSSRQLGSTPYKTPVTILENTGIRMDGYDWFKISFGNNQTGFQWGGIMCSPNAPLPGVFESCD